MAKSFFIALTMLRVALGVLFLWSGVTKTFSGFTAAGFLQNSTGPLAGLYGSMAGNVVVDFLVVFGEVGIGVALIFGLFTRFACLCGMLMMAGFYLATLPQPRGPVNDQVVYFLVFLVLATAHAGKYWGVDGITHHLPWLRHNQIIS